MLLTETAVNYSYITEGKFFLLEIKLPEDIKKANKTVELAVKSQIKENDFLFSYDRVLFPTGKEYIYIWVLDSEAQKRLDLKRNLSFVNKWYSLARQVFEKEIVQMGNFHLFIEDISGVLSVTFINQKIVNLEVLSQTINKDTYLLKYLEKFYEQYRIEVEHKGVYTSISLDMDTYKENLVIKREGSLLKDKFLNRYFYLFLTLVLLPFLLALYFQNQAPNPNLAHSIATNEFDGPNFSPIYEDLITFVGTDWSYEGNGLSGQLTITVEDIESLENLMLQLNEAIHIKRADILSLERLSDAQYKVILEISN